MKSLHRSPIFAIAMVLACGASFSHAQEKPVVMGLRAHNLFQSNMVLQRDISVDVWGWSQSGDKVTVTFAGKSVSAAADESGKWSVQLPAMEASRTPATMTIANDRGEEIRFDNILIGDVWVLGGQSNMQWGIGGVTEGNLEVASANFPEIRLLTVPKIFGQEHKTNFPRSEAFSRITGEDQYQGDWLVCSPETVRPMSAIGYVMARRIHMASQVPVGVINTSRGGTTVEAWTPMQTLRAIDAPEVKARLAEADEKLAAYDPEADLQKQIRQFEAQVAKMKQQGKDTSGLQRPTTPSGGPAKGHKIPGNCFSSVISPIAGFAVKGAIFHQGYNNCFDGVQGTRMYRAVFPETIRAWRRAFDDEAMPFLIISQCVAGMQQSHDDFLPHLADIGARIREAQYQTYLEFREAGDPHVGFISTYDLHHRNFHPRIKIPAGERAAAWALGTYYDVVGSFTTAPPKLEKMEVIDGAIKLTYSENLGNNDSGAGLEGFAIAGEDMKFQPAEIGRAEGRNAKQTLVLTSPLVPKPVHYRYAWGRNPMGNIQNDFRFAGNTVMLATQRSDNWSNADLLKALTGIEAENPTHLSRGENNALRAALAKEDRRRILAEAKAALEQADGKELD